MVGRSSVVLGEVVDGHAHDVVGRHACLALGDVILDAGLLGEL